MKNSKETKRISRHQRIRAKVKGTLDIPRLSVHRSLKGLQIQLVDDTKNQAVLSLSTSAKEVREKAAYGGNIKAANILGELFAQSAKDKGIKNVVFDRGGYAYHGRIKALASALRKGGLVF